MGGGGRAVQRNWDRRAEGSRKELNEHSRNDTAAQAQ
jgi:hypothetical protein